MLISPATLGGTLRPVASKSHLIRLLLASLLARQETTLEGYTPSADVDATLECLEALGMGHRVEGRSLHLFPTDARRDQLGVGESGTLLRMLIPLVGALGLTVTIDAKEGLRKRPVNTTLELLAAHGVAVSRDYPLRLEGQLEAGTYYVDVSMSSQFLSGFLMALPLLREDSRIRMVGHPVSIGYVQMTLDVMALYGVKVTPTVDGYIVRGGQTYRAPKHVECDGDWSSAAFWGIAGALYAPVRLQGLNPQSPHKDKAFVDILAQAGAQVEWQEGDLLVRPGELKTIQKDMRFTPDLCPIVAVMCALSEGVSHLTGVGNLRYKECDRLSAIQANLAAVGIEADYDEESDCLSIKGGAPRSGKWLGYNDHRMVMSGGILLAKTGGEVTDPEAVGKSYPTFWEDYAAMGGKSCD
ncbi:MAG: 3-phosphoshikimate 1-carboxyvinyltransferase [Clostridia bacterium]|nr:3-phosphoshikimate 1-carboxyvinyltransferase [Clostridia bacterium]